MLDLKYMHLLDGMGISVAIIRKYIFLPITIIRTENPDTRLTFKH